MAPLCIFKNSSSQRCHLSLGDLINNSFFLNYPILSMLYKAHTLARVKNVFPFNRQILYEDLNLAYVLSILEYEICIQTQILKVDLQIL